MFMLRRLNRRLVVKVADFGLSRSISTSSYYKVKTSKKLPIKWLAPECLTDRKFTQQSDVVSPDSYSVGTHFKCFQKTDSDIS
eukprot:m.20536 g.20536  ORF g.20536 m.20536 type:complete len:83 (+) comp28026_c0_seq1:2394-2642(+)